MRFKSFNWLIAIMVYINNSLHLARKYARIFQPLSCPRESEQFSESGKLGASRTDNVHGGYCGSCPSNLFRNTRSFESWGISLGHSPVLAGVYSVT